MRFLDSEEQRQHNLASIATAKLCVNVLAIAHGLSGAKGPDPRIDLKDFLPFPEWKPESAPEDGPSPETKAILTRLLQAHRIPLPVFAKLIASPEGGG